MSRLTALCERVNEQTLYNIATANSNEFRKKMVGLQLDDNYSRRSLVAFFLIAMAAARYWKSLSEQPDLNTALKSVNSDVITTEALIFSWHVLNHLSFHEMANKVQKIKANMDSMTVGEFRKATSAAPTEEDVDAIKNALLIICDTVEQATRWNVRKLVQLRIPEYTKHPPGKDATDEFTSVLLCAVAKKTIEEPDRMSLDLECGMYVPVVSIAVSSSLPAFYETYKNIVEAYPMD